MNLRGIIGGLSPFKKLLLMALLSLSVMLVFMTLGWLVMMIIDKDFMLLPERLSDFSDPKVICFLKAFQIINQVGLFIIPPLLFAWLDGGNVVKYFQLNTHTRFITILLSCLMVYSALPLIHWTASINELLHLPEWLSGIENWMKQTEANAKQITDAFLTVNTAQGLLVNLIMIAVLPALGEELFFRGVVQKLFYEWFRNIHLAIIVTAIVFSALHLQFYGFLPRTLLGIMFGYLFVLTRSLWIPIVVHFLNNATAVIAAFLFRSDMLEKDYDQIGRVTDVFWVLSSLLVVITLFAIIYKLNNKAATEPEA